MSAQASLFGEPPVPPAVALAADPDGPRPPPIGSLVWRPALRSRNGVRYATVRSWAALAKRQDLAAVTLAKRRLDPRLIEGAAAELAEWIAGLAGDVTGWSVVCVACGHSRRPDCVGKQIAQAVARLTGAPFVQAFDDRFVPGSSHPKENRKLPPLALRLAPPGAAIVVDDIATSGFHMEEALTALRRLGHPAIGVAWLGGTVQ